MGYLLKETVGNLDWLCPELFSLYYQGNFEMEKKYAFKVWTFADIFSLGIMILEIFYFDPTIHNKPLNRNEKKLHE